MSGSLIIFTIVLCILVLILVGILGLSAVLCIYLSYPKRFTREFTHQCDVEKGIIDDEIESYERRPYILKMKDNYEIHLDYIPNNASRKFVIIAHGYTWDKEGSLKYARVFYRMGFNCIIYDERSHGDNKHKAVTMGAKEASDLHEIIEDTYRRYGPDIKLGLHGESLGAATCLQSINYQDKIGFIVSDCAFSSLPELLKYKLTLSHLPHFLLPVCSIFLFLFQHYRMYSVKPENAVKKALCPVLVLHGAKDSFIPEEHAERIYANISTEKELVYFENANHAESYVSNPQKYSEVIENFLRKINF